MSEVKEVYPHLQPEFLRELDRMCGDIEGGTAGLGRDLLALLERAVLHCDDAVHREVADRMYHPWQLMKLLCGPEFNQLP